MSSTGTANPRVLRLARSDEADARVLVHVSSLSDGALDLKLVATEGEAAYTGSGMACGLKVQWTQMTSFHPR